MASTSTKIVLGRGEVYFDRFRDGTTVGEGELYIGNTTAFSISRDVDEVERFRSYGGQKIQIGSLITSEKHTGGFVTDNIDMENVALWLGGEVEQTGQTAIGSFDETLTIRRGRSYQLGLTFRQFSGVTHIEHVTVYRDGAVIEQVGNYRLNKETGRLTVLSDAANLQNGDAIRVNFEWRQSPAMQQTTSAPVEVVGALRFVSTNPIGPRKDYFFPSVRISATGEASLKGDEWQQLAFDFEARKLNPAAKFMYVQERGAAHYTRDEQAIIDEGLTFSQFARLENTLDLVVNKIIPWRGC